jgi:hypothetical protein
MEFDERLERAFTALADSLQQEIAAQLAAVRADLSRSVQADRDKAIADGANEARAVVEQEMSGRIAEAAARAGTDARAGVAASQKAAGERLVEAIRAIDTAQSLSEILNALVDSASADGGRAAIFLPQGSALMSWRLVGFDALGAAGTIELLHSDAGMIAEASETGLLIRWDSSSPRTTLLPPFVDLPSGSRALAVPLGTSSQVLAVLYVDEGNSEPALGESWPAAIEVLARHTARALEATTAMRLAQLPTTV